MERFIVDSRK